MRYVRKIAKIDYRFDTNGAHGLPFLRAGGYYLTPREK